MRLYYSNSSKQGKSCSNGKIYSACWQSEAVGRERAEEAYPFVESGAELWQSMYWWSVNWNRYRSGSPGRAMSSIDRKANFPTNWMQP